MFVPKIIAIGVLVTMVLSAANADTGPGVVTVSLGWLTSSPVKIMISPFSASGNTFNYQKLTKRLQPRDDEMISIMYAKFTNHAEVGVSARLGDVVAFVGNGRVKRMKFVAYLEEGPLTGRPIYRLSDWDYVMSILPGGTTALRLVFLVERGSHTELEKSLRIYCVFSHAVMDGMYHSISISGYPTLDQIVSERIEKVAGTTWSSESTMVRSDFMLSTALTPEAARSLSFPSNLLSSGGPSQFIEDKFLGQLGNDKTLPSWFEIAASWDRGYFQYDLCLLLLDSIMSYLERFPDNLARNAIWMRNIGVTIAVTKHKVYWVSEGYGICTLPHIVSEILLYVASQSRSAGLNPLDLAPIPGSYTAIENEKNTESVYTIDCRGVSIKVVGRGGKYAIEIEGEGGNTVFMKYNRY